jgi:hypothetical protein
MGHDPFCDDSMLGLPEAGMSTPVRRQRNPFRLIEDLIIGYLDRRDGKFPGLRMEIDWVIHPAGSFPLWSARYERRGSLWDFQARPCGPTADWRIFSRTLITESPWGGWDFEVWFGRRYVVLSRPAFPAAHLARTQAWLP